MRKDQTVFPLEIGLGKIHTQEGQTRFIATMREISTTSNVETLNVVETAQQSIQVLQSYPYIVWFNRNIRLTWLRYIPLLKRSSINCEIV